MHLEKYLKRFEKLKVNKKGGHESPHKPCMLLAVIGLAEAGKLAINQIEFSHPLLDRYLEIFNVVKTESDHANPYFPFFHLKSENFWNLKAIDGREAVLGAIESARSYGSINDNVEYVFLDDDLYDHLMNTESRNALRETLITRWFGKYSKELNALVSQDVYEKKLRQGVEKCKAEEDPNQYQKPIRDTAFRRIVIEAYDYRCAASGHRIVLPGEMIMVEAAHLIPFSETWDDDPKNGIALTPNYHWALDKNLIAPGPDFRWHISKLIDSRIADNQPLLELEGKEILLPKEKQFWPRKDALESRILSMK